MEPKNFLEAFPGLRLEKSILDLLAYVKVEKVAVNHRHTLLRVYIVSQNWIKKKNIETIERAIEDQFFAGNRMEVKIIERFRLSGSYTPANFYKVYRSSMLYELKRVDPLLYQTFIHTDIDFRRDANEIHCRVEDNFVSEKNADRLTDYIEKVFADRAGFDDSEAGGRQRGR